MGKSLSGRELGRGIDQRKNGLYRARFVDKSGRQHSISDSNYNELKAKLKEARKLWDKDYDVERSQMTLAEWFKIYLDIKRPLVANTTLSEYPITFKLIPDNFKRKRLCDVRSMDIQSMLQNSDRINTPVKKNKVIKLLRNMFKEAVDNEVLERSPVANISVTKVKTEYRNALTDKQVERFLSIAKTDCKYYPLFVLMLETGMRLGEALALTWDKVDLENNFVRVTCTYVYYPARGINEIHDHTKTPAGNRRIPLTQKAREVLEEIPHNGTEFIFISDRGELVKPSSVQRSIGILVRKLNVGEEFPSITSHYFRHTFITRCAKKGIPPEVTKVLAGHSNISITYDVYRHVHDDELQESIKLLNK